ncbi:type IVB secretion system protein IcmH/DotU [Thetidibacter halocola]|nr:type IVB secretion system protein IcmH/DotU [Thetidibacter halocola]
MSDDDDKTVFGQALPPQPPKPGAGQGKPAQGGDNEKTVFGQALPQPPRQAAPPPPPSRQPAPPPAAPYPPRVAQSGAPPPPPQHRAPPVGQQPPLQRPPHQADPWGTPPDEDTWLGGKMPTQPQPPRPTQQPAPPPPSGYSPAPQPPAYPQPTPPPRTDYRANAYRPETGHRGPEMFPEIPRPDQAQAPRAAHRKIPLADALRATGLGQGGSSNPLVASAANLMILLGRLRTGLVEMQSAPLLNHVARELDLFERNALEAGVPQPDVIDAKYALAATADDIVQNLPGVDRGMWLEYSMGARFFNDRNAGVGFFQRMDAAMKAPGQKFHLLELMLTCLSLGFEGQYRAMHDGSIQLARIRTAIYETLRRVVGRPDDDISVHWTPVIFRGKRRRGGPPVWAVGAIGAAMAVALFATLSTLLSSQSSESTQRIALMHSGLPPLAMEPAAPVLRSVEPKTTQIDRLRAALEAPIGEGSLALDVRKEWIAIRVSEAFRFASGRAELREDATPLLQEIAAAVDAEQGPVRVVGHSDGDGCCRSGPFRSNEQLSEGRAKTVSDLLGGMITDASRLSVEGKGFSEPVVTPETSPADKAQNRRVEVMIQREE